MVMFENWIESPYSRANDEPESAINLADLYWQGLDSKFYEEKKRFHYQIFVLKIFSNFQIVT